MKGHRTPTEIEARAAEALGALLHQVSSIKTRGIQFQSPRRKSTILADIDVLGHSHTLVCNVAEGDPDHVREAIHRLLTSADRKKGDATPVVIAPHLSDQARSLCEKSRVGFLDLEGNARLEVDEVFIGKRSVRSVRPAQAAARMQA